MFRLKTFLWVGFCVSGYLLFSCTDDVSQLGLDLQNPIEKLQVHNDSSSVIHTYSVQQPDSITLWPYYLLLGYCNDPALGQFQNNFMTEVSLTSFSTDFGDNPVADSLVLYLDYVAAYGDTTQTQNITVYELNKNLSLNDTAESINRQPMEESVIAKYYDASKPLMTFSFRPNPADTMPLRIKLPNSLRDRLLDTSYYHSQDTFNLKVFRGFYFVANINDGGAISYFVDDDSTRMELYYHDDTVKHAYVYDIYNETYKCNIFKRSYNPDIKVVPYKTTPDISYEQDLFYLKNNNALEGRIDISGLHTWADSGLFTINKAELILTVKPPETPSDSIYKHHASIMVFGIDSVFKRYYLGDYYDSYNQAYNSVPYDTVVDGYIVSLNYTIANAIKNGEDKVSLTIETDNSSIPANISLATRTLFLGAKAAEKPVKLKISYTKFKDK